MNRQRKYDPSRKAHITHVSIHRDANFLQELVLHFKRVNVKVGTAILPKKNQ